MSFSLQLQPQTVTVKHMARFQQKAYARSQSLLIGSCLRYISDPFFQTVDNAIHLINRY